MKSKFIKFRVGILFPFLFLFLFYSCKKEDEVIPPTGPILDLSVSSVVDKANAGVDSLITYTISAKNPGSKDAPEVIVLDTLSDGLILQSAVAQKGNYDAQTGKWTIGDLSKNTTLTLTIKAKIMAYGNIVNKAKITGKVTDNNEKNNSSITTVTTNLVGLSKDQNWTYQMFAAMKDIYLWTDALPAVLDAKKNTIAENTLEYLSGLKINPETGRAIDHYSFLDKIGNLSGEISQGTASGDYGFMITAAINSSNQVSFFVTYVYKNSPAGVAGVARTYEIVSVNGSNAVHPEVTSDGYLVSTSVGYTTVVNALFNSSTASFGFKKPDETTLTTSLNAGSYTINSVLYDKVFDVGSKKVGYVVFNQFLGASSQAELAYTIGKFQADGVKYLIVDLRYNGGGSVETCEKFSSLLVPLAANGKPMYTYKMNAALTQSAASQKENLTTNFTKTNSFEPTQIYFIVSGSTASASELLINNLRPYYTGKLFLVGQTTYGKPCGFWSTPIGYKTDQKTPKEGYDLYAVSFETVNANSEGGYYAGMTPGTSKYPGVKAFDSFWLPWGDVTDACLAQAISHISGGSFKVVSTQSRVKSVNVTPLSTIDHQFKGMIDFRKHLK